MRYDMFVSRRESLGSKNRTTGNALSERYRHALRVVDSLADEHQPSEL